MENDELTDQLHTAITQLLDDLKVPYNGRYIHLMASTIATELIDGTGADPYDWL